MEIKKNIFIGVLGVMTGCFLTSVLFPQNLNTADKPAVSALAEIANDAALSDYDYKIIDNDDGISYDGMTAVLKDATRLNVYFKLENGATIETYTDFKVDGIPVTPAPASDGSYYVTVYDISAKELGNPHVITVGNLTISNLSAITYVYRVSLLESPSEKTLALTKTLYEYYNAAEAYFCDEHDYESEIVVEATGRKAGVIKYTCKNCGGEYRETIYHSYGITFALDAAGTEYAVTGYTGENTDIVLPYEYNGLPVTKIAASAFEKSNLTSVILPKSIKTIGNNAFSACDDLAFVYYEGTAEERSGISIGDGNATFTSVCHSYSETKPTEAGAFWYYSDDQPTVWPTPVKITQEFTIAFGDVQTYVFTPTKSGNYAVTFSNKDVNIIMAYEGKYIQNWTGALAFTAGKSYTIELANIAYDDVTGILTIESAD